MLRLLGFLVVLIALVVGAGYFLGWFGFSTQRNTPNNEKLTVSLEVDSEKIKEDAETARQKAKAIGDSVQDSIAQVGAETAKGTIVSIHEAENRFVVRTMDKKELTLQMEPSAKARLNNQEVGLKDFRAGDPVTVVYKVKDGKNLARSVTVERAREEAASQPRG